METTRAQPTGVDSTVGGWSLIVGAAAFAAFWAAAPTTFNGDVPWILALGVHGVGIVTLCVGLAGLWMSARRGPSARVATVGFVVAVLGLLTVFPLFPAGLAVLAWALRRTGWPTGVCTVLLAGASSLAAVTVAYQIAVGWAIAGQDGAPDPGVGWTAWFTASILAVALGLAGLGWERLR